MLVLFIDDDPDDYDLFCEALLTIVTEAKCLHFRHGKEALIALQTVVPDYIFLDVNMPVMGGKECLQRIKKDPGLKDIPVIVYSTSSHPAEIRKFKELGAKEFIIKPGRYHELVDTLRGVLP